MQWAPPGNDSESISLDAPVNAPGLTLDQGIEGFQNGDVFGVKRLEAEITSESRRDHKSVGRAPCGGQP